MIPVRYERTDAILLAHDARAWTPLFDALRDITLQSIATVKGMLIDPGETVRVLAPVYDDELFKSRPLLGMNAPLAANARYKASEIFQLVSGVQTQSGRTGRDLTRETVHKVGTHPDN